MILVLKEKIALLSIKTRLATFIGIKQDSLGRKRLFERKTGFTLKKQDLVERKKL